MCWNGQATGMLPLSKCICSHRFVALPEALGGDRDGRGAVREARRVLPPARDGWRRGHVLQLQLIMDKRCCCNDLAHSTSTPL